MDFKFIYTEVPEDLNLKTVVRDAQLSKTNK